MTWEQEGQHAAKAAAELLDALEAPVIKEAKLEAERALYRYAEMLRGANIPRPSVIASCTGMTAAVTYKAIENETL